MKKQDEKYIIINNKLLNHESELKLTENELQMYAFLLSERNHKGIITTSIETLVYKLPLLTTNKNTSIKKKGAKKVVDSLVEKGLIYNHSEDKQILEITYNETLINEKGYTIIAYSAVEAITDPRDFLIYCGVARWRGNKEATASGCKRAFSEWAKFLGVSKSTAERAVYAVEKKGFIRKSSGAFLPSAEGEQSLQGPNTYYVNDPWKIIDVKQLKKADQVSQYAQEEIKDQVPERKIFPEDVPVIQDTKGEFMMMVHRNLEKLEALEAKDAEEEIENKEVEVQPRPETDYFVTPVKPTVEKTEDINSIDLSDVDAMLQKSLSL